LAVFANLASPFAVGVFHATQRDRYVFGEQNSLWAYALFSVVLLVVSGVLGIPDEPTDWQPALAAAALTSVIAAALISFVQIIRPGMLPRFVLVTTPVVVFPFNVVASLLSVRSGRRRASNDRVFAFLEPDEAEFLRNESAQSFPRPEVAFQLADVLEASPNRTRPGVDVPKRRSTDAGADPSGPAAADLPLADVAAESGATVFVISDRHRDDEEVIAAAARLHAGGVRIRTLEAFSDEWLGKLPLSALSRLALMTDIGEIHGGPYRHVKRMLDVIAGLALGVATLIAVPIVTVGNLAANRGPLFFRQERVGSGGRVFLIWKFRTMVPTADVETSWTRPDDPRVTPFGRLLRRTHLDELPQFVNILRGDLSIVGPRPEQPRYVTDLRSKLPFYDLRHAVQPGLTGWAQVKYRYASTEADALEKLQYDLYYLRHQAMSLDLRIMSRTARSVLRRRGR
jgi:lipopolysaccharide/colanic/teichoic acid biosynthesis glycosyltransferase